MVPPDNFRGRCLQQLLHVSCSICLSVEVLVNRTASNLDYPLCSLCVPSDMLVLGLHVAGNICTSKLQNSKPKQLQVRDPHWQAHCRSSCISNERCGARPTSGELPCRVTYRKGLLTLKSGKSGVVVEWRGPSVSKCPRRGKARCAGRQRSIRKL